VPWGYAIPTCMLSRPSRWSSLTECPLNARLETGVDLSFFLIRPSQRAATRLRYQPGSSHVYAGGWRLQVRLWQSLLVLSSFVERAGCGAAVDVALEQINGEGRIGHYCVLAIIVYWPARHPFGAPR
jgi:hypothetical protein